MSSANRPRDRSAPARSSDRRPQPAHALRYHCTKNMFHHIHISFKINKQLNLPFLYRNAFFNFACFTIVGIMEII
jgi:hypothetical protein